MLATEVESFLDQRPGFLEQLAAAPILNPSIVPSVSPDLSQIIVVPPEKIIAPSCTSKPWLSLRGQRINFAEKDAADRRLAKIGEEFVYDLERHRLKEVGRDDLASKVEWVAKTIGDGLGFDILSFDDADDSKRMLEVKATGLGKFFPFYVTATRSAALTTYLTSTTCSGSLTWGERRRSTSFTGHSRSFVSLSPCCLGQWSDARNNVIARTKVTSCLLGIMPKDRDEEGHIVCEIPEKMLWVIQVITKEEGYLFPSFAPAPAGKPNDLRNQMPATLFLAIGSISVTSYMTLY